MASVMELPDIDVLGASEAVLVETACITWSNAALRPAVVERFSKMGATARSLAEQALAPARLPGDTESNTAVVTAIAVLEALASPEAIERLKRLALDVRPVAAAHARAALERMREPLPSRETPRGPSRAELERELTEGKPKQRELGLAFALLHADLTLLPLVHAALEDGAAGVRAEAALTCARLGDATPLDLLLRRLRDRPVPKPSGARGGALPSPIRDALGAWNGLVELGDVRAFGEIARFESEPVYARLRDEHASTPGSLFSRHPAAKALRAR